MGMAVQSAKAPPGVRDDAIPGFAVAAIREDGRWRCARMDPDSLVDLDAAITELRGLRSTGAVLGLLDVDDEFFVIVRPAPGGARLFLSDATAAVDYDIARQVLEKLDSETDPDDLEDEDPFEEGDLGVLSDIGLSEGVLSIILSDDDYADEQLSRIAQEMGFGDEMSAFLDKLDR